MAKRGGSGLPPTTAPEPAKKKPRVAAVDDAPPALEIDEECEEQTYIAIANQMFDDLEKKEVWRSKAHPANASSSASASVTSASASTPSTSPSEKEIEGVVDKILASGDTKSQPPKQEKVVVATTATAAAAAPATDVNVNAKDAKSNEPVPNEEQAHALSLFKAGKSICISGPAGTGKTMTSRFAEKYARDNGLRMLKTSMTGISAEAIGGVTLHKALGMGICDKPMGAYVKIAQAGLEEQQKLVAEMEKCRARVTLLKAERDAKAALDAKKPKSQFSNPPAIYHSKIGSAYRTPQEQAALEMRMDPYNVALCQFDDARILAEKHLATRLRRADVIQIDEFELINPTVLMIVCLILQTIRQGRPKLMPQLLLTGDVLQASAINPRPRDDLPAHMKHLFDYHQMNCFFLLDTDVWKQLGIQMVELTRVIRQSEATFVSVLSGVRFACLMWEHQRWLRSRSFTTTDWKKGRTEIQPDEYGNLPPMFTGTREAAEEHNDAQLVKLPTEPFCAYVEVFYIHVDPKTNELWHRCIYVGNTSNFEYVHEFRRQNDGRAVASASASSSDGAAVSASASASASSSSNMGTQQLPRRVREQLQNFVADRLKTSLVQPIARYKDEAGILFTETVFNDQKVIINNGTAGRIIGHCGLTTGYETVDGKYRQDRPTEYIRLRRGDVPPTDAYIKVRCKGKDVVVRPSEVWEPFLPEDIGKKPQECSRTVVIRKFPLMRSDALTADKAISMEFDAGIVDCEPMLAKRGDSTGLFYVALSRIRNPDRVYLKDYSETVIRANPNAIRHTRHACEFMKNMSAKQFEAFLAEHTETTYTGARYFQYFAPPSKSNPYT